MNFLKNLVGLGNSLENQIKSTKIDGSFYKIIGDTRNIILPQCTISFLHRDDQYFIQFQSYKQDKQQSYQFPIHQDMNLVSFKMNKAGKQNACFQWVLDSDNQNIGCYMSPQKKNIFKEILCQILKKTVNDPNIGNCLDYCEQLQAIPVYKKQTSKSTISQKQSAILKQNTNQILMKEARLKQNKLVNIAQLFQIVGNERTLVKDNIIFTLRSLGNFTYQFNVINQTGFIFLRKQLTPSLVYEINTDIGYLKWLQISQNSKIYQINFQGKRDVALSLKFDIIECLYEINTKRKLTDAIAEDQISYLKRINNQKVVQYNQNSKIVQIYGSKDQKQKISEISQKTFVYNNQQAKQGLKKYRTFTQGKVHNISVAALGSMLQTLKIDQSNQIKHTSHHRLFNKQSIQVDSKVLLLHDNDNKIMAIGTQGKLYYHDMNKQKLINQYAVDPNDGLIDIHPSCKFAGGQNYNTFKAISSDAIFQIDPRLEKGFENFKQYSTDPQFNSISVDQKGRFAIGAQSGQIRLYNKIGNNANCKYSSFGQKVLHLDSTKDGRWLLATFPSFLILLPTQTQQQDSLYERKVPFKQRLSPIKLTIKLQHLQICKVTQLNFIPAKFDQSSDSREKYIVSGFGDYVIVWNLSQAIKGDIWNYKFSKTNGKLLQVDFKYNDIRKLIMVSQEGIKIKQNRVKNI